jgi:hypothetical protein
MGPVRSPTSSHAPTPPFMRPRPTAATPSASPVNLDRRARTTRTIDTAAIAATHTTHATERVTTNSALQVRTSDAAGNWSGWATASNPAATAKGGKVRGGKVLVKKNGKAKLTWRSTPGATSYKMRISRPGGSRFRAWKPATAPWLSFSTRQDLQGADQGDRTRRSRPHSTLKARSK